MSVYVDELRTSVRTANWPHKRSCHMFADSLDELHEMAGLIGLSRSWFQARANFPHYDVTAYKRAQAFARGALCVDNELAVAFARGERPYPFRGTEDAR